MPEHKLCRISAPSWICYEPSGGACSLPVDHHGDHFWGHYSWPNRKGVHGEIHERSDGTRESGVQA